MISLISTLLMIYFNPFLSIMKITDKTASFFNLTFQVLFAGLFCGAFLFPVLWYVFVLHVLIGFGMFVRNIMR
jgi:hypothetical protein